MMDKPTTKELARFFDKVQVTKHCWLWTGKASKGKYGQFYFRGRAVLVHRFSYELFVGPIKPGFCILHTRECGNPTCVNPHHLYMGTHADNMRDMVLWGNQCRGEDHPFVKLSEEDVLAIREIHKDKRNKQKDTATLFGISAPHVSYIVSGKKRKQLTPAGKSALEN